MEQEVNLFTIYDLKSKTYFDPLFFTNKDDLDAYLKFLVNDSKNEVSKYPNDFILYEMGHFDSNTGLISLKKLTPLHSLADFKIYKETANG